jgi:ribulose-5-phosphate 4-epimerase/fuculose-1-phosphate aldolase
MLDTMADVMKAAYNLNWITTRDGNVSLRRKNTPYLYITPSGARKQNLTSEQMIKLQFPESPQTDQPWHEMTRVRDEYQDRIVGLRPSGELPFHYLLQENINTSNRVVLHLHCTHTVAAIRRGIRLQDITQDFPELSGLTRVGPAVPLTEARSTQLGHAVYDAFQVQPDGAVSADIVVVEGHGVVAVDVDPWRAFEHAERLEHIAQIVLLSGKW